MKLNLNKSQNPRTRSVAGGKSRWLRKPLRLLPAAGAAMLLVGATPVFADQKAGARDAHNGNHRHHPAAEIRRVERQVNRAARRVARQLETLQPVSHRNKRGHQHDKYREHRAERHHDRYSKRWHKSRYYDRPRGDRFGHAYFRADPRYTPMTFRQWKRYQWRLTHDGRYVTERGYRRYLKKYRKHYRHGHRQHDYAQIDHRGLRHRGKRNW